MNRKLLKKLHRLGDIMNNESEFPLTIIRWYLVPPVYRWYFKPLYRAMAAVLTEHEIDMLLILGNDRLTRAELRERTGWSHNDFNKTFDTLIGKKAVLWTEKGARGKTVFRIAPMMLGWFELSCSDGAVTPERKLFSKELGRFFNRIKLMNFTGGRAIINRLIFGLGPMSGIAKLPPAIETKTKAKGAKTVAVDLTVDLPEARIYSAGGVNAMIEKYGGNGQIAVTKCLCRQHWALEGEPCRLDLPIDAHLWIGPFADHVVTYGYGRRISKNEAHDIVQRVRDRGGIFEVMHARMDVEHEPGLSICGCCWDCCTALGNYNRGLMPLAVKAYYKATNPDKNKCTVCGLCVEYCPVSAMQVKNGQLFHDPGLCIGCGQCEYRCPEGAVVMEPDERVVRLNMLKKSNRKPAFRN
jgi:ferredoxin